MPRSWPYTEVAYGWLYLIGHAPAFVASGVLAAVAQTSLISRFSTVLLIIPWIVTSHVLVMALSLGIMARRAQSNLARERRIAMDQALEILSGRCARLELTIIRPETPEPMILHGYPTTLAHVLMVLLGNALDVLEARRIALPRVILGLEGTESEIVVTVEDNGGGIDLYPIDRVFETFVSEKGKRHMGMGLGIARRLVEERMGGTVRAENVDGGSRFILRLPRRG